MVLDRSRGDPTELHRRSFSRAAKSSRLTSAVRIPTAPLRPGSSVAFGHEVAGSAPGSGKLAAVELCHGVVLQPDPPLGSSLDG